jgi:prepilin-type N-terminal cleavage/methylation domain-containing protein
MTRHHPLLQGIRCASSNRTYRPHRAGRPSSHSSPASRSDGFTLVEVLIAVVILATGVVVVLQGLHASLSVLEGAIDKTRSEMLVRSKIVEAQAAALMRESPSSLGSSGHFEEPYEAYRWRLDADTAARSVGGDGGDSAGAGNLHEITVTVWRENSERTYAASTLVHVRPATESTFQGGGL